MEIPGAVPVPLIATDVGLPAALCVMLRLAALSPVPVGLNVRLIVQVAFGAKAVEQVFVWAN